MSDWDRRELCPDGACVGVIGPDGTCKVCGRAAANWGDERNRGLTPLPADGFDDDEDEDDDDDDAEYEDDDDAEYEDDAPADDQPAAALAAPVEEGEWGERKLCPDGACTGVIGPGNRCKVCGRSAA